MKYSQATANLIERMCRNVERLDFELDKAKATECLLQTYDVFHQPRPKKIVWCTDLTDKSYQNAARSASLALSASSALSARSASSAWSALDYDFDSFVFGFEYAQNPDKNLPPNDNDSKYLEYCELLMQAKECGLGYRVEYENTLYLVPTPLVRINALNQFHSDEIPAIVWRGGQELYYLNGVHFPEDLFKKVTSGTMPFQDILAIKDIDQRTQAMRFGDVEEFLKHSKAELLDSYIKMNPKDILIPINYRLFKIPKGDIFTQDAYYAVYNDPSTNKLYMSGVEPAKTVAEAMGWKFDITPETWKAMVPLVHES